MIGAFSLARVEERVVEKLRQTVDGVPQRARLPGALAEALQETRLLLPRGEVAQLERHLDDRLFGLGPLAPLLRDPAVSEVMVNGHRGVWVERAGG